MTPPFLPRALVAAVAPPADYESIAGDLREEYAARAASMGRALADRWYWSQALRSLPGLLSYSRSRHNAGANAAAVAVVAGAFLAMLLCKAGIDEAIGTVYRAEGAGLWPYFVADWIDTAFFGALLALIFRSESVRLTFIVSLVFVGGFVIAILLGLMAPLHAVAWILLLGAIPAMTFGAVAYHVVRRR